MARVLKLMVLGLIFALIGFFSDLHSGTLFGFYIQYPPILNLIFLVASAGFLPVYFQVCETKESDYADFMKAISHIFLFGFTTSSILYGIQFFTGGNFVLPILYVIQIVFSCALGWVYIEEGAYNAKEAILGPMLILLMAAGMSIYVNVVPLFIVASIPHLCIVFIAECFIKRNILVDFKEGIETRTSRLKNKAKNGFSNLREKVFMFGRWIVK
ncbi:MAG: hypothetical protein WC842_04250 [Candidatus Paceibacterota bacterium]|jgi:hypothetical protein